MRQAMDTSSTQVVTISKTIICPSRLLRRKIGGTHVILVKKPHEDIPSDSSVIEAAELAAHFSREIINEENLTTDKDKIIEVDYCPVSHLKKIPKAKPGMVIYEGYYSINVSPKEIKHKTSDSD